MIKRSYLGGGSALAVTIALGLGSAAYAQAAKAPDAPADVEEVVVTGSFIAGTPEDAALPVDVLSSKDLAEQGSPTIVQLVKTITASQSALGESNRYNGGAGTATINLRGFGAARTLTLFNGRRLADSPAAAFQGGGANLNFIPSAAIGRIEILKDGAAATYGSDAVAGVVNFITRKDLDGLDVDAEYAFIDGSDGDYSANVAWGKKFDNGNVLLTAGFRHRSRLDIHERGFALRSFDFAGPAGTAAGFTGATNPGFFSVAGVAGTTLRDNGCQELGGTLTNAFVYANPLLGQPNQTAASISAAVPVNALNPATPFSNCRFQFSNFNDLVNQEDHYQLYGEVNFEFSDKLAFHGEVAWTKNDVPQQRLSPANLTAQYPSPVSIGGTSFSTATPSGPNLTVPYNVPINNPGLIALLTECRAPLTVTQCTTIFNAASSPNPAQPGAPGGARGLDISQLGWRAVAFAGHPLNPDKADHQVITNDGFRVSGGLKGELFAGIKFDSAVTYMEQTNTTNISDLLVRNIQLALRGFGAKANDPQGCTAAETNNFTTGAGSAALGCFFFNPFTNGVATSAVNGQANPFASASVINDPQVVAWLYGNYTNVLTNQLLVADLVLSGETGIELAGGNVAWAAGGQYRYTREIRKFGSFFNNETFPCPDRSACSDPTGALQFFGSGTDRDNDANVWAVFAEIQIPVLDNLNVNAAIRHEEYQGNIGATTNPKIAVKWQALDWLAFRGTASTTFRAPPVGLTLNSCASGVRILGSSYRAFQSCGNPNLKPEKADTYNLGVLVERGNFSATLDYFNFKFTNEIIEESASRLFATMFFDGAAGNCGNAAFAALQARFTFAGACGAGNIARLRNFITNGPQTKTSGFEFRAQYDMDGWMDAHYAVGVEATYLIEYKRSPVNLLDSTIVISPAEDRAGQSDGLNEFFSYPEVKANFFLSANKGPYTARWQTRYAEGTSPAFGSPFFILTPSSSAPGRSLTPVGKGKDYWQHDLILRWETPWDMTVTASVQNVLDKDPPFQPGPYNYDISQGNPLGRVFEIGARKRF